MDLLKAFEFDQSEIKPLVQDYVDFLDGNTGAVFIPYRFTVAQYADKEFKNEVCYIASMAITHQTGPDR